MDYGNIYLVFHAIKKFKLFSIINTTFLKYSDTIISLIIYQLLSGQTMTHSQNWFDGSYLSSLFPNINLSSQYISKVFPYISSEQRAFNFFSEYINTCLNNSYNILIDSTALPSSVNFFENRWGYTSYGLKQNVSCLILVDKKNKLPLFFTVLPGDIPDVSLLKNTISQVQNLGLNTNEAIFDAGFFLMTIFIF